MFSRVTARIKLADLAIFGSCCEAIQQTLIHINKQTHAVRLKVEISALAPEGVAAINLDEVALKTTGPLFDQPTNQPMKRKMRIEEFYTHTSFWGWDVTMRRNRNVYEKLILFQFLLYSG